MENSKQIFFCENCKKPILVFWDKKGRFCSRSCLSAYTAKNNSNIKASREKQHKESIQRKIDQKLEKEKINQQESSCPFCKRIFSTRRCLSNHLHQCVQNPNRVIHRVRIPKEALIRAGKRKRHENEQPREIRFCQFCKKDLFTTKTGLTLHERYCKQNPSKKQCKIGGYRAGIVTWEKSQKRQTKKGYYKGLYCMSSWELAWVYFQLENGKKVEQCKERFEYEMNGEIHHYTPDFKMDGVYYEIKGLRGKEFDFKLRDFPKDKELIVLEGYNKLKPFLIFVEQRFGKDFWKKLYES